MTPEKETETLDALYFLIKLAIFLIVFISLGILFHKVNKLEGMFNKIQITSNISTIEEIEQKE